MSDALERVRGIEQIPIFPLPLVLLPNEFMPLHIFEDRYRQMLDDIGPEGGLFGVSRFEPTESFVDKPEIGTIGCVAEVRDAQLLPDGRSDILTLGIIRYKLLGYVDTGKPYRVSDVVFFEDDKSESDIRPLADEVFGVFERIAKAAFKMSGHSGHFPEIQRTDPESFSYLATAALNFENDLKYRILEMTSTSERLEKLREVLLKTVDHMEESADIQVVSKTNGHSKKKLDI